jgi:hypothetical protein
MSILLASGAGMAQGATPAVPAAPQYHEITGFRGAHFGMTEAQVRAAIARDFPEQAAHIQQAELPTPEVRALVLPVPALEPGPGPAGLTYLFNTKSGKLIQVNVLWSTGPTPDEAERNRLATAGMQLAEYFRVLKWRPNAATMGVPLGPNGLVLFSGIDPKDAMVEVSLMGMPIRGKDGASVAPEGQARLRVAYLSTTGKAAPAPARK